MSPSPIAKRVASYKVKNPEKVKMKLKEYDAIAQKRLTDQFYDDEYEKKERDRKRRQSSEEERRIQFS